MREFATFNLGKSLFGLDVLVVREVNRLMTITPVPQSPDHIRGLINLRGHVATIMNLDVRLGLSSARKQDTPHQVILRTNAELNSIRTSLQRPDLVTCEDTIGFVVDGVGDVVEVADNEVEPVPAGNDQPGSEYFSGVVMLQRQLLSILDVEKIVRNEGSAAAKRAG